MIIFALAGLFTIQLISIFIIVILYSKVAKFKDLEVRQDRLVREMDDAIGAYLLEMREENDRLIQELKSANVVQPSAEQPKQQMMQEPAVSSTAASVNPQTVEALLTEARTVVPKAVAANVYNKHKSQQEPGLVVKKELPTFEQQVVADYRAGLSVEEIAKKTQRGKTEIELLIKFHA